jgi:DNA-3-methyladenine glycosylase I
MRNYHDHEWGVPSHNDLHLFEMLTLEGAQAGLSWATILNRRDGYRLAFANFDPAKVATFGEGRLEQLRQDTGIIRNRLKIYGTRTNAQAFVRVQAEFGSFAAYLWNWVDGTRIVNHPRALADLPATTELSDRISKDLRRRAFTFVGSTIVYSLLQAVGIVDDHLVSCPVKRKLEPERQAARFSSGSRPRARRQTRRRTAYKSAEK